MTDALHALLNGAVDYAGLFPPAQLGMRDAVREYAAHRASPDAWMLGRFVLPVARVAEFATCRGELAEDRAAWPLSVVCRDDVTALLAARKLLNDTGAAIVAAELRASSADEIGRIADALSTVSIDTFVEVPVRDDPAPLIEVFRDRGLGAKIRTGGTTPDAFPAAAEVERFLRACIAAGVRFKATAGLHHPVRGVYPLTYEPRSASALMFGYLNVFLAAALIDHGADAEDARALLEEQDATAIAFDEGNARWRGHVIGADALRSLRTRFAGFGSCSFNEPVRELAEVTA